MERTYFTKAEAEAKIGKRIRTLGGTILPEGETGTVIRSDKIHQGHTVTVEFDLPPGSLSQLIRELAIMAAERFVVQNRKFIVNSLTKAEYEQWFAEIATIGEGK